MRLFRIGDKVVSRDKLLDAIDAILEERESGATQEEAARHAEVPPSTEIARMPLAARTSTIERLRLPVSQITYTSSSRGNWAKNIQIRLIGVSVAPGTWPWTYSAGSRTSITRAPSACRVMNVAMST